MSSNFRRTFLMFWRKFWCIVLNKKEKFFVKKNANHIISIYGNCMNSIFLRATTKNFLKSPPQFFLCFFSSKMIFVLKKNMQHLIICVYNVVLDVLIWDFFHFLLIIFFKGAQDSFFLYGMFLYALINVW